MKLAKIVASFFLFVDDLTSVYKRKLLNLAKHDMGIVSGTSRHLIATVMIYLRKIMTAYENQINLMKKVKELNKKSFFRLTILILVSLTGISSTEEDATSANDVYDTREIVFYGYDYTHFRIADVKRLDEDIKKHMFLWIGLCQEHITEKKLPSWLDKERVTFNFDPTLALNKKLKSDDLGAITKHTISKDSIQSYVNEYKLTEKEGIGFVLILECFDNDSKRTSGYFTFFDIATKQVLMSDYVSSRDGRMGYNSVSDWGYAVVGAFEKYLKVYKENRKLYERRGK